MVPILSHLSRRFYCRKVSSEASSFKFENLRITLAPESERKTKPTKDFSFGRDFSDHMLQIRWNQEVGWSHPEIVPLQNFSIHPASKVLHYSQTVFEGLKAYRGDDNKIRLFRPDQNVHRFLDSSSRACLPPFDPGELLKCIKKLIDIERDWVPNAEHTSLYIRPTHIGTEAMLGVASSMDSILFVITGPSGPYFKTGIKPVSLLAHPGFIRAWPKGTGCYKMGSNYAPTLYVQKIAESMGHQQVLWLFGDDHQLTEVGAMNIFAYLINEKGEKELVTPPLDQDIILPGITRKSVLELTRSWNEFKVSERNLPMGEVLQALSEKRLLEIFGSGTACVICPVGRIHYEGKDYTIPTAESKDGLCRKLAETITGIQYGRVKYKDWAHELD
ncbi:branched chain amino acid transaminase [Brevipalpus obovatus]|uniref:branched chain amino acid transaminase n=1 Tax=Brevipalpus obovatus TaxID=246614 RepID=UPI003D9E944D